MEELERRVRHLDIDAEGIKGSETGGSSTAAPGAIQVAGLDTALQALNELIGWPQHHAEAGRKLGVLWPKGILLHGPPGCGKTLLVHAVAAECGARVHTILASDIFSAHTGESEAALRAAFRDAEQAAATTPIVVFLDEVDVLCPRRSAGRQHEARVVAQLLTLLDGADRSRTDAGGVVIVAATNRPNAIDPALRRPGRLDREIAIPVPDAEARHAIMSVQTDRMPLEDGIDLASVAASAVGYSGADLAALCREAAMLALGDEALQEDSQIYEDAGAAGLPVPVSSAHFRAAMAIVRPSITRGAEVDIQPVGWDSIGGLHDVKRRLRQAVEWPLLHADAFQRLGLSPPRGVLLHGPPGCCKTTLARAAATASRASFQALSSSQLYSAYLGEGEAILRAAFSRARAAAPAIVFLDELDALAGSRGIVGADSGGADVSARLLSTLLTEMDGMQLAKDVLVLGATNRPQAIDPALLRPGRFDVHLYVPPPDKEGRLETLRIHCSRMPLASDVHLKGIAERTDGFTGAELAGICREAASAALREDVQRADKTSARHFEAALAAVTPALTSAAIAEYSSWRR